MSKKQSKVESSDAMIASRSLHTARQESINQLIMALANNSKKRFITQELSESITFMVATDNSKSYELYVTISAKPDNDGRWYAMRERTTVNTDNTESYTYDVRKYADSALNPLTDSFLYSVKFIQVNRNSGVNAGFQKREAIKQGTLAEFFVALAPRGESARLYRWDKDYSRYSDYVLPDNLTSLLTTDALIDVSRAKVESFINGIVNHTWNKPTLPAGKEHKASNDMALAKWRMSKDARLNPNNKLMAELRSARKAKSANATNGKVKTTNKFSKRNKTKTS